jgi:glycosyltransferase 2 family protein
VVVKKILKIGIPILLSAVLIGLLFKGQDIGKIFDDIKGADYRWIILSFGLSMVSHLARASRWRQLYVPIGYRPSIFRVLMAILFGYFMNIFFPRAGEISRCGLLVKTDEIPLDVSIGTVVAERAIDVLTILVLILFALSINFQLFADIYGSAVGQIPQGGGDTKSTGIIIGVGIAVGVLIILISIFRRRIFGMRFLAKARSLFRNVWKGVLSVKYVRNKPLFIFNTLVIWMMYFFVSYVVFFSIPATANLGWEVGLTVLVVSGIAMLVPVQGGIGAYHLFISTALVFFGLSQEDGLVYATLMHASQMILYLVSGGISFIIAMLLSRRSKIKI